jgi:hypothetical protein
MIQNILLNMMKHQVAVACAATEAYWRVLHAVYRGQDVNQVLYKEEKSNA